MTDNHYKNQPWYVRYWKEAVQEALDEAGVEATDKQVDVITAHLEISIENEGTACGYDAIPDPRQQELSRVKVELERERRKVVCPTCKGSCQQIIGDSGSGRWSQSECPSCRGEGKVDG